MNQCFVPGCGCYTPCLLYQHGAQEFSTKLVEKGEQPPISTPKNEVANALEKEGGMPAIEVLDGSLDDENESFEPAAIEMSRS